MSEPSEAPQHEAGDLGNTDVDETLKDEVAKGPPDAETGDPFKGGEDSHDAVGQSAPSSETDLTP